MNQTYEICHISIFIWLMGLFVCANSNKIYDYHGPMVRHGTPFSDSGAAI
jgi:hypothetical protein